MTLHEGHAATSLSQIAETTEVTAAHLRHVLDERSRRLRREFNLSAPPFTVDGASVQTSGIAGILRLGPDVEMEIVPKCLAPANPDWRSDFLLMATVTRHGRIFRRERVSANLRKGPDDLLSLLAEIFLDEFERLVRVPIREYRRFAWVDADIDGELDYADLWEPRPEGFAQTGSRLSVDNPFMGTISEAAAYLGAASIDRGVGQRLQRLTAAFGEPAYGRPRARVPGRHQRWQELYDLARDVLAGHGMQLASGGTRRAPGFLLLKTEQCWEDLLVLALRTRGGMLGAQAKPQLPLGTRNQGKEPDSTRPIFATPDVLLSPPSFPGRIVVDAKYKDNSETTMDRSDVYEALGFLKAADSEVAILVHPSADTATSSAQTGAVTVFDEVLIPPFRVIGVTTNTRGIGARDGFSQFGRTLSRDLLSIAQHDIAQRALTRDA